MTGLTPGPRIDRYEFSLLCGGATLFLARAVPIPVHYTHVALYHVGSRRSTDHYNMQERSTLLGDERPRLIVPAAEGTSDRRRTPQCGSYEALKRELRGGRESTRFGGESLQP